MYGSFYFNRTSATIGAWKCILLGKYDKPTDQPTDGR